MFEVFVKTRIGLLFCLLTLAGSACWAERLDKKGSTGALAGVWDSSKYITVDEVRPGMEAYCLTVYEGTEVKKFNLEVLSVVRNVRPGRDAILVQGTDEPFIHTGPVAGCSGSPVYINSRLAGALAFGWTFSKDPVYGVTPIEEMLRVGQAERFEQPKDQMGFVFDFSRPVDFAEIDEQMNIVLRAPADGRRATKLTTLPCPLITSGLPGEVSEQLDALVKPFGLMVVAGIGGGSSPLESQQAAGGLRDTRLTPGACLAVPLVTGDITMTAIGTVTEVVGDRVYGLGHSFLGYGPIDLPMATGQIHTVVSSVARSFKLGSALEVVGALTVDESTAVRGQIGAKARMIPLTIKVDRYNDIDKRLYNCQVANNRLLTPQIIRAVVAGAALMLGRLPPDNMVEYKVTIGVEGAESISFENVSTTLGLAEMITESVGSVALLMNNPYKKVDIKSMDFDIRILPRNIVSHIWSVDLSDSRVKAGQTVGISVVVESVLAGKKRYHYNLKIPEELPPGRYDLIVCGGYDYQKFLRKAAPYKFIPQNMAGLIEAINNILSIDRSGLYCLLLLPPGGVAVEKAELPDLPATKALVLGDAKRTLRAQPYQRWLENSLETATIVIDKKVMRVTVEK